MTKNIINDQLDLFDIEIDILPANDGVDLIDTKKEAMERLQVVISDLSTAQKLSLLKRLTEKANTMEVKNVQD